MCEKNTRLLDVFQDAKKLFRSTYFLDKGIEILIRSGN
jgi:hypothetical protein